MYGSTAVTVYVWATPAADVAGGWGNPVTRNWEVAAGSTDRAWVAGLTVPDLSVTVRIVWSDGGTVSVPDACLNTRVNVCVPLSPPGPVVNV